MSAALEQRWATFLEKVSARLAELEAEARAGLAELVATEVVDPGPVAAALNEVKARLFALDDKVEKAWRETIEPGFEDDVERREVLERQGEALRARIGQVREQLEADAEASVTARLEELAREERAARKLSCSKCGAALPEPAVQHRPENVTCAHCQAVNTVRPGLAMAMLFHRRPRRKES